MYPLVEPYASGWLAVGDGHRLYWEEVGDPDGLPAVVLHGGPGAGVTPAWRRCFDPRRYRVVLFDQRGCGRSTPHAAGRDLDWSTVTTAHLVADIERLRRARGVRRWLVLGASWGSVLALAYAQRHPGRVRAMVLFALATGRRAETDLLTRGLGGLFPGAWTAFRDHVPARWRGGDLAAAYHRLLTDPDPAVCAAAARAWCAWEVAMLPTAPPSPRYDDPVFRLGFARMVTHFWRHGSWLREGELIAGAAGLGRIPGALVQGVLDLGNLVGTPWLLHGAWPGSSLTMVDDAGHGAGDAVAARVVAATDGFADNGG